MRKNGSHMGQNPSGTHSMEGSSKLSRKFLESARLKYSPEEQETNHASSSTAMQRQDSEKEAVKKIKFSFLENCAGNDNCQPKESRKRLKLSKTKKTETERCDRYPADKWNQSNTETTLKSPVHRTGFCIAAEEYSRRQKKKEEKYSNNHNLPHSQPSIAIHRSPDNGKIKPPSSYVHSPSLFSSDSEDECLSAHISRKKKPKHDFLIDSPDTSSDERRSRGFSMNSVSRSSPASPVFGSTQLENARSLNSSQSMDESSTNISPLKIRGRSIDFSSDLDISPPPPMQTKSHLSISPMSPKTPLYERVNRGLKERMKKKHKHTINPFSGTKEMYGSNYKETKKKSEQFGDSTDLSNFRTTTTNSGNHYAGEHEAKASSSKDKHTRKKRKISARSGQDSEISAVLKDLPCPVTSSRHVSSGSTNDSVIFLSETEAPSPHHHGRKKNESKKQQTEQSIFTDDGIVQLSPDPVASVNQMQSDEMIAKRLQEEMDLEYATYLQGNSSPHHNATPGHYEHHHHLLDSPVTSPVRVRSSMIDTSPIRLRSSLMATSPARRRPQDRRAGHNVSARGAMRDYERELFELDSHLAMLTRMGDWTVHRGFDQPMQSNRRRRRVYPDDPEFLHMLGFRQHSPPTAAYNPRRRGRRGRQPSSKL